MIMIITSERLKVPIIFEYVGNFVREIYNVSVTRKIVEELCRSTTFISLVEFDGLIN